MRKVSEAWFVIYYDEALKVRCFANSPVAGFSTQRKALIYAQSFRRSRGLDEGDVAIFEYSLVDGDMGDTTLADIREWRKRKKSA